MVLQKLFYNCKGVRSESIGVVSKMLPEVHSDFFTNSFVNFFRSSLAFCFRFFSEVSPGLTVEVPPEYLSGVLVGLYLKLLHEISPEALPFSRSSSKSSSENFFSSSSGNGFGGLREIISEI